MDLFYLHGILPYGIVVINQFNSERYILIQNKIPVIYIIGFPFSNNFGQCYECMSLVSNNCFRRTTDTIEVIF